MNTGADTIAYIGLGSNVGERSGWIEVAIEKLNHIDGIAVAARSDIIETKPLARMDQPDYLNAVAKVSTSLTPQQLLKEMLGIEDALERTRSEKWAPRTIDLDLLLYGDKVIATERLTVPHPQMHLRSFVLGGLCQLDANLTHPLLDRSMQQLADRLNAGNFCLQGELPQLISIAGVIGVGKTTLATGLAENLNCSILREAYDENPYMAEVYAGNTALALDSELFFLKNSTTQLAKDSLPCAKPVISDYIFYKAMPYARFWLDPDQFARYEKVYSDVLPTVAIPVLMIHLIDSMENCLERIQQRDRPYERQIDVDFLQKLDDEHKIFFAGWDRSPVITISAERFDCRDSEAIVRLANEIRYYIAG